MIEIIPAIDIIDGKCVRLCKGNFSRKKIYFSDPLDVAKKFEDIGFKRLHLVDLDGAKEQHIVNYKVLAKITSKTNLIVDFGGGLKSDDDLRIAFECGAAMVTGGSIAVKDKFNFLHWLEKYGNDKIILGADVKDEKIYVSGWQEKTEINLFHYLTDYINNGITKVICTDINKDGMMQGVTINLYNKIINMFPNLYLIASGGVTTIVDIEELIKIKVPAVIVGKAIYENTISLEELYKYNYNNKT